MEKNEMRKPFFEETSVGKLKQRIYRMSDKEIDALLKEYEIPASGEIEKPGCYIQNTIRGELAENRKKNDRKSSMPYLAPCINLPR